jgi:hypothetical protein
VVRKFLPAGAVVVVLLLGSGAAATGAAHSWRASYTSPYPLPSGRVGALTSVVALSPNNALAAGFADANYSGPRYPVIKHWNGTGWSTWKHQETVSPNTGYTIDDIAATSLSNVWIVTTPNSTSGNLDDTRRVRHWDGHSWKPVTLSGLPQNWFGSLLLIAGRPWLVGDGVTYPLDPRSAFIASFGKVRGKPHWTTQTYSRTGALNGGFVRTSRDAWTVGGTFDGQYSPPDGVALAEHWNGKRWHRTPLPHPVGTLAAVAAASRHSALAVGATTNSHYKQSPVAFVWNGKKWHSISAPGRATSLHAVAVDPSGGYWAAGEVTGDQTHTAYFHYMAGHWSTSVGQRRVLHGARSRQFTVVDDMTTLAGRIWSVGFIGANCDSDDCATNNAGKFFVDRR